MLSTQLFPISSLILDVQSDNSKGVNLILGLGKASPWNSYFNQSPKGIDIVNGKRDKNVVDIF